MATTDAEKNLKEIEQHIIELESAIAETGDEDLQLVLKELHQCRADLLAVVVDDQHALDTQKQPAQHAACSGTEEPDACGPSQLERPWICPADDWVTHPLYEAIRYLPEQLIDTAWGVIHGERLSVGHLVLFRCAHVWRLGVVEGLKYDETGVERQFSALAELGIFVKHNDVRQPVVRAVSVRLAAPETSEERVCAHDGNCATPNWPCEHTTSVVASEDVRPVRWNPATDITVGLVVLFLSPNHNKLWRRGVVTEANPDTAHVTVTCQIDGHPTAAQCPGESTVGRWSAILPVLEPVDAARGQFRTTIRSDSAEDHAGVLEDALNKQNCPQYFAAWEKYTKGFGSRMLRKMGYKMGEPLCPPSSRADRSKPLLREPLPIRILSPRVGLGHVKNNKTKKSPAAGKVLQFQRPGLFFFFITFICR